MSPGTCFERILPWRSDSKHIYHGGCSTSPYSYGTSAWTFLAGLILFLCSFLWVLCISLNPHGQSIDHVVIFPLNSAGPSIENLCKPRLLCLDSWASSFGYFASGPYWPWWRSPCFAYCGMHFLQFSFFADFFSLKLWLFLYESSFSPLLMGNFIVRNIF